ncbi:mitochondrial carrier domain-containing protein [Xylariomycetidae sp. FL0641]|nr:mitochondrial carrier domain-containing protein [Xylariomycetidae sp. FL0641]
MERDRSPKYSATFLGYKHKYELRRCMRQNNIHQVDSATQLNPEILQAHGNRSVNRASVIEDEKPPFFPFQYVRAFRFANLVSMTPNHAGLSPASVETIAGLTAGSVATLVVHPLDIVKTRMQIHRTAAEAAAAAKSQRQQQQRSSPTTISVLRALARSPNPLASLYRGLTPNLVGAASSWASFFFFKARIEAGLARRKPPNDPLAPRDYFAASGLAGAATQVLTNPVWVLKTRMVSTDAGAAGAYPGMAAGAARVWRAEGWRGFYRGLGVSLLGVSHGAVQFAVYEPLKRAYVSRRRGHGDEERRLGTQGTLLVSSVAKLVAGAATYPYQVVRSRLQNHDAEARFGRGVRGVVARTWREEGPRGFYRGIVPGVVRVMPATWVTFLVYENMKFYLPQWTG